MFWSKLIGSVAAIFALIASGTSAIACGSAFAQALLFHKYPEAKAATSAIAIARALGTLRGDEWNKATGKSLHAWRAGKVKVTVRALQRRFNSAAAPSSVPVKTSVFLINEFAWIDIASGESGITVSRTPYGWAKTGNRIFTSRRVLDKMLHGAVTWRQAVAQGLITFRCNGTCTETANRLLKVTFARRQQSQSGAN